MSYYTKYQINDSEIREIPSHLKRLFAGTIATELAESHEHEQGNYPDEAEYDICLFTREQEIERYKVYPKNVRQFFAEKED